MNQSMKQSLSLGVALLVFCGVSAWAQMAGHSGAQPAVGEAEADCGVLGVCPSQDPNFLPSIFSYRCAGNNVVVTRCQEGSTLVKGPGFCKGPSKEIKKVDFLAFIKAQLDKPIWADNTELSKSDVDAAKAKVESGECRQTLSQQAKALERQIEIFKTTKASEGVISKAEKQLSDLKTQLGVANDQALKCVSSKDALAKIEEQSQRAIETICNNKDDTIAPAGTFLHTVLSQYDPSKHACDTEADCKQQVKLKSGAIVGTVVKRADTNEGLNQEYLRDNVTKITWSPEAKPMNQFEAQNYCKDKTDLGLKWELPKKTDFEVAFLKNLSETFDLGDGATIWSGEGASIKTYESEPKKQTYWVYKAVKGNKFAELLTTTLNPVRCISRPIAKK
jgi:hypothetical protein